MRTRAELHASAIKAVQLLNARKVQKENLTTEIIRDYVRMFEQLGKMFPKDQVHEHECGTCGQLRECHHLPCFYNALADCDPGYGHKTEKREVREEVFACQVCPSHLAPLDVEEHMQKHGSQGGVVCNQHPDITIDDLQTFNHHLRIRHAR